VTSFGTFSQLNTNVTAGLGSGACVPAAVANGLQFLANTYSITGLMQTGNSGYNTVNTLAKLMDTTSQGTLFPDQVYGLTNYLGPGYQNVANLVSIAGGQSTADIVNGFTNIQNNTYPTGTNLFNWLNANDAVEFTVNEFYSGTNFLHTMTLWGISVATNASGVPTGNGTLSFIDPDGPSGVALIFTNAMFTTVGGILAITNGWDSATGPIGVALAEAVIIPEPTPLAILVPVALALVVRRLRRPVQVGKRVVTGVKS
jgi:hypothetical protein